MAIEESTNSFFTYRGYTIKLWVSSKDAINNLMWYDYEISRKKGIWHAPTVYLHLEEALMYAKDDIDDIIIGPKKPMSSRRYKKKYSWIDTKTRHV